MRYSVILLALLPILARSAIPENSCSADGKSKIVNGVTIACTESTSCVIVAEQNPQCVVESVKSQYVKKPAGTKPTYKIQSGKVESIAKETATKMEGRTESAPTVVTEAGVATTYYTVSRSSTALYVVQTPLFFTKNAEPSATPKPADYELAEGATPPLPTIGFPVEPAAKADQLFLKNLPVGSYINTGGYACGVVGPKANGVYASCQGPMGSGFDFMEGNAGACLANTKTLATELEMSDVTQAPIVGMFWDGYKHPEPGSFPYCGKHVKISAKGTDTWYRLPVADNCPTCSGVSPLRTGLYANMNGATIDLSYTAHMLLFGSETGQEGVFDVEWEWMD